MGEGGLRVGIGKNWWVMVGIIDVTYKTYRKIIENIQKGKCKK